MKLSRNIRVMLLPVFIALIAIGGFFLLSRPANPSATVQAPDFSYRLLNGKKVALSDYRGKTPVVMNFWASWCPPCQAEAPTLAKIAKIYRGKVRFLGIVVQDTAPNAEKFIKQFGIPYSNGLDSTGGIGRGYKITGVPETFFITKDGVARAHWIGAIEEKTLTGYIDKLIGN